jgi:hypothetical protein
MAGMAMVMNETTRRKQMVEEAEQILVTAGTHLDQRQAGGGVRHEHREEAVAESGHEV